MYTLVLKYKFYFLALVVLSFATPLCAETVGNSDLEAKVDHLSAQLERALSRIEELEARQQKQDEEDLLAPAITRPARPTHNVYQNQNPDISVIGMASAKYSTDKRDSKRNRIGLDEIELTFSGAISPYARGQLSLHIDDDHADVEEGFVDLNLLPGGVEARLGKFLVPAGFLNQIHAHDWPMVEPPLAFELFFDDEGWSERGISFSKYFNLGNKSILKAHANILDGKSDELFNDAQTRVYGTRLAIESPLNDNDDLRLGLNYHEGAWNPRGDLYSRVYGADLMLRRRFSLYDRLVLWGEWFWNEREQLNTSSFTTNSYYMSAMYKFRNVRDWHVGVMHNFAQRPDDKSANYVSNSAYVGYWLTENDRLQFEFRRTADGFNRETNNEIMLQFIWGFGPHRPHLIHF